MPQNMNSLDLVEQILQDARASTKQASLQKAATDPSDPTTNPVMKADDGTRPVHEGSRSAENDADIRKALGNQGIAGQSDANSADQSKLTDTIGTIKQDSTELKGNAKAPKTEKDLPPESKGHPSNVTGKYASLISKGNSILQKLAEKKEPKEAKPDMTPMRDTDSSQPAKIKPPFGKKAAAEELEKEAQMKFAAAQEYEDDAAAGYMAAEILVNQLGLSKQAEEQEVAMQVILTNIIKTAHADAQNVADYLEGTAAGARTAYNQRVKFAEEAMEAPAAEEGGGQMPPEAMAAMQGGGGMLGSGMPPGAEGGAGGEIDPNVEALVKALEAEGITPEQLEAVLAEQGAGGGEGGMPPGGGMPEEGGAMPQPGPEKTGSYRKNQLQSTLNRLRI